MLIHPWDAALDTEEWQTWIATHDTFGVLVVNTDPAQAPLLVPTHFTPADDELLLHLARPNPAWPHLEAATEVRVARLSNASAPFFEVAVALTFRSRPSRSRCWVLGAGPVPAADVGDRDLTERAEDGSRSPAGLRAPPGWW